MQLSVLLKVSNDQIRNGAIRTCLFGHICTSNDYHMFFTYARICYLHVLEFESGGN